MRSLCIAMALTTGLVCGATMTAEPATAGATIEQSHPGLASGVLTHARMADLPQGVLLKSGEIAINEKELAEVGADAPPKFREQLARNGFFVLEHLAAPKLLAAAAREDAAKAGRDLSATTEREIVQGYVTTALETVRVPDADVKAFYEQNKTMFGGASFDAVKPQLTQYLLQEKQQRALRALIVSLGQKRPIEVSASWTAAQALLARDNPVDKARFSGKPSMVDFGRGGCGPCDIMTPILETLKTKYEGRANVVFVNVGDEELLGMRYGIESIPVQVFFDKNGVEVFRHTGFFPQAEIEKKMAELGVQ